MALLDSKRGKLKMQLGQSEDEREQLQSLIKAVQTNNAEEIGKWAERLN